MIQASERWVYDRLGSYKTITISTEYVSPEIGEILLQGKAGDIFSVLIGKHELETLLTDLHRLVVHMEEATP